MCSVNLPPLWQVFLVCGKGWILTPRMNPSRRQSGAFLYGREPLSWLPWAVWVTGLLIITYPGFSDNAFVSMVSRDRLDQSYILCVSGVEPAGVVLCGNRDWQADNSLRCGSASWQVVFGSVTVVELNSPVLGFNFTVYNSKRSFGNTRTLIPCPVVWHWVIDIRLHQTCSFRDPTNHSK